MWIKSATERFSLCSLAATMMAVVLGFGTTAQTQRLNPERQPRRQSETKIQVPDGVTLETDLAYRKGNEKWRLDLAYPEAKSKTRRPGLVIVHGGGWRGGDKGGGQWRSIPLQYAAEGYVCISVNYRLTDEAPFPACVEDVKCAVRWLRANADKYGLDPSRIGAYGNSAGAHLVAMLGLVGPDARLEGDGPYKEQSSLVQAVCCSATPTDFCNWGGPGKSFRGESTLLAGPSEGLDDRKRQASPISHVGPDAPPFLIIHGNADRTVPFTQGELFAEALKKAGAKDVTFLEFEGAGHGVFGQHSDETGPAMERFFARTLKGRQDDRKTEPQGTTAIGRKQPNRKPTARQQRPGDREPSWLMPPVKGPNLFYRTIATREGRCVEGFSMGGSGAAKWGFKYPEHLGKLGLEHEFHIIPESPHTPNPLYDGLGDKNWAFFRAAFASSGNLSK